MLHLQPYIRQLKNALLQNFATHHHQTSPSVQKPPDPTKYLGKPWKAKGNRKNPYRILKQSWPSLWLVPHPFFFFLPVAPWEKSSLDRITSPFWSLQKRNRTIKSEVWSAERSGPQWQYERPVFRATSFCFCPTGFHAHSRLPSRTCIPVHLRASCRRISKTHTGESTESIESVSTPSKAINSRLCECISRWIDHSASRCITVHRYASCKEPVASDRIQGRTSAGDALRMHEAAVHRGYALAHASRRQKCISRLHSRRARLHWRRGQPIGLSGDEFTPPGPAHRAPRRAVCFKDLLVPLQTLFFLFIAPFFLFFFWFFLHLDSSLLASPPRRYPLLPNAITRSVRIEPSISKYLFPSYTFRNLLVNFCLNVQRPRSDEFIVL